jgi:hypothetical protein
VLIGCSYRRRGGGGGEASNKAPAVTAPAVTVSAVTVSASDTSLPVSATSNEKEAKRIDDGVSAVSTEKISTGGGGRHEMSASGAAGEEMWEPISSKEEDVFEEENCDDADGHMKKKSRT